MNKYVLAVKISEPKIRRVGGIDLALIQKVAVLNLRPCQFCLKVVTEVGGVSSSTCTAFLSDLEDWNEDVGVVYGSNNQAAKAILFPFVGLINISGILHFIESNIP